LLFAYFAYLAATLTYTLSFNLERRDGVADGRGELEAGLW
jgi:hypothetical protein